MEQFEEEPLRSAHEPPLQTQAPSPCCRVNIHMGPLKHTPDGAAEYWAGAPPSPTPGHYHVLYQGCGETQVGWHGETYCLVGGYRTYGDAPVATPAKTEAEKPIPSQAPKRRRAMAESNKDVGCSSPKIRRLKHGGRRMTPKKLAD